MILPRVRELRFFGNTAESYSRVTADGEIDQSEACVRQTRSAAKIQCAEGEGKKEEREGGIDPSGVRKVIPRLFISRTYACLIRRARNTTAWSLEAWVCVSVIRVAIFTEASNEVAASVNTSNYDVGGNFRRSALAV